MELITNINTALVLLFCALSAYQYIYIIVSVFFPPVRFTAKRLCRFGVLICARNEEKVITQLIDSIKKQTYPAELIDIFVLADNCTDRTAEIAAAAGAHVYERHNLKKVGKAYALNELLSHIGEDYGEEHFDGYLILDADNLILPEYIERMNTVFSNGYRVVTSYRNSKNFATNWITAGYGLMFMREARHMNNARMILHTSAVISGTGFMVHRDIIRENGGWPFYTLTEDLEFSMVMIARGEKFGYCHDAVFYDEQPTKFRQSWNQRIRWAKGFLQSLRHGGKVLRGIFSKKSGFSCFDEVMSTFPTLLMSIFATVAVGSMVYSLIAYPGYDALTFFYSLGGYLASIYFVNFLLGLVTTVTEWKKITAPAYKKILYTFTFPLFIMVGIPIAIAACFARSEWKPIEHTDSKSLEQLESEIAAAGVELDAPQRDEEAPTE